MRLISKVPQNFRKKQTKVIFHYDPHLTRNMNWISSHNHQFIRLRHCLNLLPRIWQQQAFLRIGCCWSYVIKQYCNFAFEFLWILGMVIISRTFTSPFLANYLYVFHGYRLIQSFALSGTMQLCNFCWIMRLWLYIEVFFYKFNSNWFSTWVLVKGWL